MLKVLLVDDEPYVLEGLKTMVDWAAYGFSEPLEASDGEDALETVKRSNPDLVITDIKMPVMDGIELIRQSIETYRSTAEFVILSGYDDFAYAREAMLYHVGDYLLKPIDSEELGSLVSKMTTLIREKKKKSDSDRRQLSFIACQCIRRAIHGEMTDSLLKRIGTLLNIGEEEDVRCILIESDAPSGEARQLVEDTLGAPFSLHLFEDDTGRLGIMAAQNMPFYPSIGNFVSGIIRELAKHTKDEPTAAVSLPGKGPRSFSAVYHQALLALKYRFFSKDQRVIYYQDIMDISLDPGLCTRDLDSLLDTVRSGDDPKIDGIVDRLFDYFAQNRKAPGAIMAYLNCFDLELVKLIMEMDGDPEGFSHAALELGKGVDHLTICELKDFFRSHCRYASGYIQSIRQANPQSVVNDMKIYIRQHLSQNIKLKTVAKVFFMNPVYLGQIFKKSTGMQFTDYLTWLRIEEAKKLLKRSDMQVQEVARAVGFQDVKYFSNKFKAVTSLPPSEYKERCCDANPDTGSPSAW